MRVLDVSNLEQGTEETIRAIQEKIKSMDTIEKTIRDLISLDDSFKGKGAEAIKSFYEDCHHPFLVKSKQVLSDYESKLKETRTALAALEPVDTGFIRQSFLHSDLTNVLYNAKAITQEITSEANQAIASVQDIAPIPYLDDSAVIQNLHNSELEIKETNEKLEEFDHQQTTSTKSLISELQLLNQYVHEIDTKIASGKLNVGSYNSKQLSGLASRYLVISTTKPEQGNISYLTLQGMEARKRKALFEMMGIDYPVYKLGQALAKEKTGEVKKEKDKFLGPGDTTTKNGVTLNASVGMAEGEWNKKDQIGGKGAISGVHVSAEHDTKIVDSKFSQDIGKAEAQASIGGSTIFPLVKAAGSIYNVQAKTQLDKKIPVLGGSGAEAQGDILKGKAYAGLDGSSVGVGLKGAVAEGEVSGIMHIPWTDYNFKGTVGGSAFGAGGEIKVGREFVVDLRMLLGVKVGISVEKQE